MVVLPSNIGPVFFGVPLGLYALLGLIPFILLYLIRPRPKRMELPSLMFFIRSGGKSVVQSFFRNILRDMLILIQLIILLALLLIPSQPYTSTTVNLAAEHSVFVIDTSASSQALLDGTTRLQHSIEQAKGLLGKKNSIVLAKGTPDVIVQSVNADEARRRLSTITSTDTSSRIGEAMLLAGQLLEGDGRIVVISDFDNTEGIEPLLAKAALESRGKHVTLIDTAKGPVDNIGFIDLSVGDDTSVAYLRNYGTADKTLTVHIGERTQEASIPAGGITPIRFSTPPGITELKIDNEDAFPLDDKIEISAPEQAKIRVLLITNDKSKFLESALTASPRIALTTSQPPIISKEEFDIIIVDHVNPSDVLAGTYDDLLKRARSGTGVVVNAQLGMGATNYEKLLPVIVTGEGKDASVRTDQDTVMTRNLEFSNVKQYIQARPAIGAISIASVLDNSTIITLKPEGAGFVMYYGLLESASDFKLSPDYPIFWQSSLRALAQRADVRDLNRKTGETIATDASTVAEGPDGNIKGPLISLDKHGHYTIGDRTVVANFLDPLESALRFHPEIQTQASTVGDATLKEERRYDWEHMLLWAAAIFLIIELTFLKVRGDI